MRLREPRAAIDPTPSDLAITMFVDRSTHMPIAVRWGEGADLWRTEHIVAFERLPDDVRNRSYLDFTRG